MQPINVSDRDFRKLLISNIREAAQIDAIHLADRCFISHTEAANTTVLAEIVMVFPGVESILCQFRLTRQ
ncbi:MAG: hypothetical protein ABS69_05690 [Nitrosomonadales bacterium SCN 54-20]|nr:MAG: hypothetical protein ABS69_05690 [Nitrosomonadales bacterium SCN 54-20]